jgi:glycosyltransferase involved in cell wall biosynthesis
MEFLLAAARTVAEKAPSATFLISGYGPLRERLEAQARQLGVDARVRFLGYRKDVALILAASDVFALPSLWEGMSNAVLEAMAAGKPVVATAVDGAVDQVLPGESGLLVPPGDADALAQALLDLARDPRKAQEMGIKGRERVRREFSLDRMTDAYIELYRRLLEK